MFESFRRIGKAESASQSAEPVPSYLEDPNLREERELKALHATVESKMKALEESGELDSLEGETLLQKVREIGTGILLDLVSEKYENPSNPETRLAYHNRAHSEDVVRRFRQLAAAINAEVPGRISLLEQTEGEFAAAGHDSEHVFEEGQAGIRKRRPEEGERRSAVRVTVLKVAFNEALRRRGKSEAFMIDPEMDQAAIAVTVASYDHDVRNIVQAHLSDKTPLTHVLLALADLGDFGMQGPKKLLESGRKLAIEDNSDIVEAVRQGAVGDNEQAYRNRLLGMMKFQSGFAQARRNRFAVDTASVREPKVREAIAREFKYFDEEMFKKAQEAIEAEVGPLDDLSFKELAENIGIPTFIRERALSAA